MVNLLDRSRLYFFLRGLSKKARLFFTLFFLILAFTFWLFLFYLPLKQDIGIQTLNYSNNSDLQKVYEEKLKLFDDIKKENILLEARFKSEFEKNKSLKSELDFILNLINQNNLFCKKFSPYKSTKNDLCKKDYYSLKIKGDFKSIISFFNQLKKYSCKIKFKDYCFEKKGKNNVLLDAKIRVLKFLEV